MVITDYRVQSVLRTYSRQLQRSRLVHGAEDSEVGRLPVGKIDISEEAKRRLIRERVTSQALEQAHTAREDCHPGEQSGSTFPCR